MHDEHVSRTLCLQLSDRTAALLLRVQTIFCVAAGYSAEAAVGLLKSDMEQLCFSHATQADADGSLPGLFRSRAELASIEEALRMRDLIDAAARAGDEDVAMKALHVAADHFLPDRDAIQVAEVTQAPPASIWAALVWGSCCRRGIALLERQRLYSKLATAKDCY